MHRFLTEEGFSNFEVLSLRIMALIAERAADNMYVEWMQCSFNGEKNTWECGIQFEDIFDQS